MNDTSPDTGTGDVEALCILFHDAYESAAVSAGWETQERSRKPWADVPEANKETMRATIRAVLASDWLAAHTAAAEARGAQAERERRLDYAVIKGYELGYAEALREAAESIEADKASLLADLNQKGVAFALQATVTEGHDRAIGILTARAARETAARVGSPEVCSTCGGAFDSPPCSLNREIGWSGHTRSGGVATGTRVEGGA